MSIPKTKTLEDFLDYNSQDNLFLRYARGRARGFLIRQTMTVVGSLTIGAIADPYLGFLTAFVALLGEAIDCAALKWISKRAIPTKLGRFRVLAALTGAVQSCTIASCVVICWTMTSDDSARFFAASFLMSAVINAGLVRKYFPLGAHIRLAVFGVTGMALVLSNTFNGMDRDPRAEWFFFIAVLVLGYTSTLFIRTIERGQVERNRFERALLQESEALNIARLEAATAARKAARLALVAQKANDSIVFSQPNAKIEWVNDAFTRITGYSRSEVIGRTPAEVLNAPETSHDALRELARCYEDLQPRRIEVQNLTKQNKLIWMEVSLTPVLNEAGKPEVFIAIEREITEAKAREVELAQARVAAEAAAHAKSQFLATMSHEIRTPMNGVIGVAELLEETALDPTQRNYVSTIVDSGRALLTIINDVLDLSKLQAGRVDLNAEPFSIETSVNRALDLLRPTAMKKGLCLSAIVPDDMPLHLGDAGRLRQILLNLLGNAVKFTSTGSVTVTVSLRPDSKADLLAIAVSDTGIGIPPDRIGTVFESFTQADAAIARQFGGTGLGLTISRLLAQRMGGDIEVASEFGSGSTFTLSLRLPRAFEVPNPTNFSRSSGPMTNLRLLVAEDNRTNMLITRKILEKHVHSIVEATNGKEAVAAYWKAPPDLILMDISMPEMPGHEATRQIRRFETEAGLPRCPIVALTAYSSQEEAELCLAAGMDAVLTKPLVRAELYALLERTAASRDHFDLSPTNGLDRASIGGSKWSTSQRASGTTSGK